MKEEESWIPKSSKDGTIDLPITQRTLMKIATGATIFFLPKNQDPELRQRLQETIEKICAIIDADYAELDDKGRRGISVVIASTWAASFIIKIESMAAQFKKEGKL